MGSPRGRTVLTLLMPIVLLVPSSASAETTQVLIVDIPPSFNPEIVAGRVGDAVHWSKPIGTPIEHNIIQNSGLFVSGAPSGGAIDYTVTFSAGRFPYYCDVHGGPDGGMVGVVRVAPKILAAPAGHRFTLRWAGSATETGRAFDVQFARGDGRWRTWLRNTTRRKGVFGRGGRPVALSEGVYRFRARSQVDVSSGRAHSQWSPTVAHTVVLEAPD